MKLIGKFTKRKQRAYRDQRICRNRSRICSYLKDNNENSETTKGIKKIVIKKDTKHEDYKKTHCTVVKTIRSDHRQLGRYELNKVSLSYFDDKRYIYNIERQSYKGTIMGIATKYLFKIYFITFVYTNNFLSIYPKDANR